jgi:hypothetical protein
VITKVCLQIVIIRNKLAKRDQEDDHCAYTSGSDSLLFGGKKNTLRTCLFICNKKEKLHMLHSNKIKKDWSYLEEYELHKAIEK